MNLSQLTQVQKCIKESQNSGKVISPKDTLDILEKLEHKNSYETQKALAVEFDRPVQTHESIKPQQDDSVRIQITLTQEQFKELEQAKSLLSHICHEGNWADVISTLAKNYNDRKLVGRTKKKTTDYKRIKTTPHTQSNETPEASPQRFVATATKKSRKYISVNIKRELMSKADNCCEYVNPKTKQRCNSKYKLQKDHIQPFSQGGSDEVKNLRVLCQAHNNYRNVSSSNHY